MAPLMLCMILVIFKTNSVIGQSLARFKTVTMSSTNGDWDGSRAVDDNYGYGSNPNDCDCCAGTNTATNSVHQWLEIDLGETQTFTRIVVHGRTDNDYERQNMIGLAIYLDDAATSIASIPNTGQGHVRFYNFDLGQKYSARKIKLVLERDDAKLVLCEVDVFNDSQISKGASVTMSSQYDNWDGARAVEGQLATNADACRCCSATRNSDQTDQWLNIDLGDTFLITYMQMYGRTDFKYPSQSFEGVKIDIDGTHIDTIPSGSHVDYYEVFPVPEKIGRQIKLTTVGTGKLLVMCEIVIYGERVVSIQSSAQQSSLFFDWAASRAVDGDYNTLPASCVCCAATGYELDPWLRVDLGPGYTVSRIVIYGRTDGPYNGQSFSDMTVSLDTKVIHTIPTTTEWIDFYSFGLSTVQQATSVTLTLVGSSKQLVVCELVVYGDCINGVYGRTCDRTCHCAGATCPTISGICPGKCLPGYKTETCSEECEDGRYGQDCAMNCSQNCKDDNPCNHITGHCQECKPGYKYSDPFCNTPCDDGSYGNNCVGICGKCRESQPCNFVTGHCTECEDGFKYSDVFCKTACDSGTYGTNCNETCGKCRNGETCNTVNGMCTDCMDGYTETDMTCKTPCPSGTYGENCAQQCGSCKNAPCNHVTGRCDDCLNGVYVLGNTLCNMVCNPYSYGYNCSQPCGNCRNDVSCGSVNGECNSCEYGYTIEDTTCKTVCSWGTFGDNCANECGFCFDNETCHHVNGSCTECAAGYTGTFCSDAFVGSPPSDEDDNSTAIIIGVIIPVILILAIVMIVIIVLRKRRVRKQPKDDLVAEPDRIYANSGAFDNNIIVQEQDKEIKKKPVEVPVEDTPDNEYYSFTNTTPGIAVHKLWDYIAINKERKGEGFMTEFKKLKDGLLFPYKDAMANRKKNRYREMYPYDHSRVHLNVEREGESEFINASHIDGYDKTGKFIASQGPIDVMVDDFWRMVWQQQTTKIVMLTNLVENGTTKCIQYWPEDKTVDYKRINITIVEEDTVSDYSVRTLDIKQDNGPPRRIKQYHYKAWPDKDVPDSTWSLVRFWREVFEEQTDKPVVVHCSAGVGRTGTFIAMDNLYHQAVATGGVTPFTIVETLRNQRIKMVQTSDQYKYLHEAVADTLLFGTHYIWESQYPEYYDFMVQKDDANGGKIRLNQQFDLMEKNIAEKNPASKRNGENQAYTKEIDEYRPKASLSSKAATDKQTPILLPSLGGSDSFILTSIPNSKTVTDCWKVIGDHNVKTVITLVGDTQSESTIWSSMNKQSCETYSPVNVAERKLGPVTERTFSYSKQTKGKTNDAKVKQMELSLSASTDPSKQADSVYTLFDLVGKWHQYISTKEPVLIQCRDGVAISAIAAVLLNEKLRLVRDGGQLHILDSAMLVKRANPSCISSYKQYRFIHDILLHALEKKDPVYSEAVENGGAADLDEENIYQNA